VVKACQPRRATVIGEFAPRGGLSTLVTARYEQTKDGKRRRAGKKKS
jgi:NADPH-dependent 7-cyano-7-deazaguanine reductase QueF